VPAQPQEEIAARKKVGAALLEEDTGNSLVCRKSKNLSRSIDYHRQHNVRGKQ
jgi:hypothetical protein